MIHFIIITLPAVLRWQTMRVSDIATEQARDHWALDFTHCRLFGGVPGILIECRAVLSMSIR